MLTIYNCSGRVVRTIKLNNLVTNKVTWNAKDDFGKIVSGGIYFYQIAIGKKIVNGEMIVIR